MQTIKPANMPIRALRGDKKSPSPYINMSDIIKCVNDLKEKLQREHDLNREQVHRTLLIAMHTDALWER